MALQKKPNIGVQVAQTMTPSKIYTPEEVAPAYKAPSANGGGDPLWMKTLNAIGALSKPFTQQLDYWTDGVSNKKDNPFYSMGYHLGYAPNKAFFDEVFQNGLSFGAFKKMDNPSAFGILNHMSKNMSGFDQTLENRGVTNPYVKGIGGFVGDVLLDPTTYVTFGGSAAVKAGTKGMQKTAKTLVKEANQVLGKGTLKAGRNAYRTLPDQAAQAYYRQAIEKTGNEEIARIAAEKARTNFAERISNAGKESRYKAQNAAFNIDVPFTNITWQFGKKPASLSKNSPKIAQTGANSLTRQLNRAGLVGDNATQFVAKALGKTNLADVTLQEYRWLQNEIKRYGEFATQNAPKIAFDGSEDAARAFNQVDNFEFGKFVPEMGGLSPVGQRWADRFRALNPRAVGTEASGGLVNSYGDAIQDTFNRVRNNARNFDDEVRIAGQYLDNLNDVEKRLLEYTLEGAMPRGFIAAGADLNKVQEAANFLRGRYQNMAQVEQAVGALDKTMPNYAPHVLKRSEADLEEILQRYADDPELQRLAQVSAASGFNQSRKSFKTMAELDNYISGLGQQIARETDPAVAARLSQKLEDVGNLFERDPFTAYKKRLYKSYRVRELSKLYRQMEADNLLLTPQAAKELGGVPTGFTKLDAKEAAKLNVPAGSVMHKEVKNALLKVDNLFTDQGLNKFLETVTSVTNIWKSLATSFRPVHHVNNIIGNVFNNSMAGVGIPSYKKAAEVLNRSFRGKPKQEDLKLIQDAIEHGVFGQVHSDEYRRLFGNQNASALRKAEKMVTDNRYVNFMRKWVGDTTDNWTRFAHFISVKNKTGSSELAAQSVRKYLFNYGEQTSTDRAIRLLIPFWTWTKNNIPLQIENMIKQPRYAQTYYRLQDTSYEVHGEKREDQADFIRNSYFMTPYAGTEFAENMPFFGDLRNPRAPVADLNNLDNPLKFLGESTTPLIRVPLFEVPMNEQLFSGKTIDQQLERTGERDWGAWGRYGLSQAAFANDLFKVGTGDTNFFDILFGRELDMRKE
ncbi:hypothetical protein D1872_89980 [compost metagenome]